MNERVYVLIDATEGKAGQVVQVLRGQPGVEMVDLLEGPPNVLVMLQARSIRKLADLTNRALASAEDMTEGAQVLPVRN
jgi:hypothetical protein